MVFDIALHHTPVGTSANGADVVAVTPELTAPEFFFEGGQTKKKLTGCNSLDDLDDLTNAVLGMEADQQVDVILVVADLFKAYVIALGDTIQGLVNTTHNVFIQECLAILDREDNVVVRIVDTVVRASDRHGHIIS